jgi:cytochrome c553
MNYFPRIPFANDGDSDLEARGEKSGRQYRVLLCLSRSGCRSVEDIPRLGGPAYFYLKGRLEQWGQGYHSGVGSPMPMVADHLGPNEIEALASYLSFVKASDGSALHVR